jgi:arylsulfatase A-like enzyme
MKKIVLAIALITCFKFGLSAQDASKPNIILVMTDDQGWGQTSYMAHPILKTPNLDAMAANGLRFNRFYAGAPVCSPTRASVLTGRSNDRTAVFEHGHALRKQEKTIAQALKKVGYSTAHFGKWHLNGHRGAGVPIFKEDDRNPGQFGFDDWLSVSNFFDINPIMSRNGEFVEFKGESSHIIVDEAINHIKNKKDDGKPLFIVIWFGSPHAPWMSDDDKSAFAHLDEASQNHYAELVSMDQSIGKLRNSLRDLKVADNTLVWFNSDNGGLHHFGSQTVGGLRKFKGSVYEGGIRVPCIIEWPETIKFSRITNYPSSTMDIFPTIAEVVGLDASNMGAPIDGTSISKLFETDILSRDKPIPFRMNDKRAWIDNNYKIVTEDLKNNEFELYDLSKDPSEITNIILEKPEIAKKMIQEFTAWNKSVDASVAGKDYKGGLKEPDPERVFWETLPQYKPYFNEWKKRPEYKRLLKLDKK